MIFNVITQDNKKVLEDKSNEAVKLHRLERSMQESMYTFQSVVEAEQPNDLPRQKHPLVENEISSSIPNTEQRIEKSTKIRKGGKGHLIAICVEARAEACGETPP